MLAKFGLFKDYLTVDNAKIGLNTGAFLASLYQLYTNPQEHTATFLLDLSTHGLTLLSMRKNATDFEKYAAMFLNAGRELNITGSLAMGSKELPVAVQYVDAGVHLLNLATGPLPTDEAEGETEEATQAAKMK